MPAERGLNAEAETFVPRMAAAADRHGKKVGLNPEAEVFVPDAKRRRAEETMLDDGALSEERTGEEDDIDFEKDEEEMREDEEDEDGMNEDDVRKDDDEYDDLIGVSDSDEEESFKPEDTDEEEQEDDEESSEGGREEGDEEDDKEDKDEESGEEKDEEQEEKGKEDETKGEDEEHVTMQTQNITELMKNKTFLLEDDVDVTFLQECKVKEADMAKAKKSFRNKSYDLTCGPHNRETKKPSAGVGCASRADKAEVICPPHVTEAFKEAWRLGRAEKYQVDLGWEQMLWVYNVYGQAGSKKEDIAVTEAIIAAIREEMEHEPKLPTYVVGDVNANPEKLQGFQELVSEDGWIDVGLHANWWGKPQE
jgi:hypothetical protein